MNVRLFRLLLSLLLALIPILVWSGDVRSAAPLPPGRTLSVDGHNNGYIDWAGPVSVQSHYHADAICPTGCTETVTRLEPGGVAGGALAAYPIAMFRVGVSQSYDPGVGIATLTACTASASVDLFLPGGGGSDGYINLYLSVPAGCTTWSLTASRGYVYFRHVDVTYAPTPTPAAPTPTFTFTPVPPTATFTPTFTATPSSPATLSSASRQAAGFVPPPLATTRMPFSFSVGSSARIVMFTKSVA